MRNSFAFLFNLLKKLPSTFHILDSLSSTSQGIKESKQLQAILLKHFPGQKYADSRLTTNVPKVFSFSLANNSWLQSISQVPAQLNSKDCACFTIYFGKKFIQNPHATLALIKVFYPIYWQMHYLTSYCRLRLPTSAKDFPLGDWKTITSRLSVANWGLCFSNTSQKERQLSNIINQLTSSHFKRCFSWSGPSGPKKNRSDYPL